MKNVEDRLAMLEQEIHELRSHLGTSSPIEAPFCIVGANGNPLLSVRETQRGAELTLYDAAGGRIAVVGQALNGGNGIAIFNSAGKRVAGLFADRDGGHLAVYTNGGIGVGGIQATADGGFLSAGDNDGQNRISLFSSTEGVALGFFEGGIPVLTLPEDSEIQPQS